jgi:hypothetical protein
MGNAKSPDSISDIHNLTNASIDALLSDPDENIRVRVLGLTIAAGKMSRARWKSALRDPSNIVLNEALLKCQKLSLQDCLYAFKQNDPSVVASAILNQYFTNNLVTAEYIKHLFLSPAFDFKKTQNVTLFSQLFVYSLRSAHLQCHDSPLVSLQQLTKFSESFKALPREKKIFFNTSAREGSASYILLNHLSFTPSKEEEKSPPISTFSSSFIDPSILNKWETERDRNSTQRLLQCYAPNHTIIKSRKKSI